MKYHPSNANCLRFFKILQSVPILLTHTLIGSTENLFYCFERLASVTSDRTALCGWNCDVQFPTRKTLNECLRDPIKLLRCGFHGKKAKVLVQLMLIMKWGEKACFPRLDTHYIFIVLEEWEETRNHTLIVRKMYTSASGHQCLKSKLNTYQVINSKRLSIQTAIISTHRTKGDVKDGHKRWYEGTCIHWLTQKVFINLI